MNVRAIGLVEPVYSELKRRLQLSEVGVDDRLIDAELAEQFGVSRMPVREALLRLVSEGYLVGTTRGFAVKPLSLDDIRDWFEVRRQLEPRAAACAARDLDDRAEKALSDAMARIRSGLANDDISTLLKANIDFRNAWISAIANRHLAETVIRFLDYFQSVRIDTFRDAALRHSYVDSLEALYQAFTARDSIAAQDRMTSYLLVAEDAFRAVRERQLTGQRPAGRRNTKKGSRR
jgi:DNA-binding GntR family transcriptional regulator